MSVPVTYGVLYGLCTDVGLETKKSFPHHHHENVARCVDDLVQPHDVRMSTKLEDIDLPLDLVLHVQGLDLAPVQNLHSDLVLGQRVLSHLSRNKRT